ncbi:hypothetical protein FOA52_013073 [Chlamydomonas sp. UWO 241]|nr:hypothetical protein FOA52_013073 [Chlamydomonas sp. UWO 241]
MHAALLTIPTSWPRTPKQLPTLWRCANGFTRAPGLSHALWYSAGRAKKWAKMTAIPSPEAPTVTAGYIIKDKAVLLRPNLLQNDVYCHCAAIVGGLVISGPFGSAAVGAAAANKFGVIDEKPLPEFWIAENPPNVTMTQLAFICFKVH